MKNEIFEADYTRTHETDSGESSLIFETAIRTGFFKKYSDIMASIPKVIIQADKLNYEELLPRLDALAKRKGGKIKGIVSYEKWDANIYITLPFFEFVHKDEYELLRDLVDKTNGLTFTVTEDGSIQLSVMINYFEELGSTDDIFNQALSENDELIDALMQGIEKRKAALLEHPFIGKVIKRAALNAGISAEEFIDTSLDAIESDPEGQLNTIAALLEARDEIIEEEE